MPKAPTSHKLSSEDQKFLCRCIAEFKTAKEIVGLLKERGRDVQVSLIYQYKCEDKWRPIIQKFRQRYIGKLDDVPGVHKRVRIERMDRVADKAEENEEFSSVISATRQQQLEIEGNNTITNNTLIFQQYNHMSDEEIEKRKDQLLRFLKTKQEPVEIEGEVKNV